ncbi:MAG: thioredoxin domain-containing protein [Chloroherpetonaceae bacterium]|nr:thioredoxin domain-containing protein [Chloroherpetonaceae bacterium]
MTHSKYTNKLKDEKSPYLLQHAHNPVDWFPWGDEAFQKAEQENKPIFLSIGYSTCHWCHVMEHESFENEKTAEILNRSFVSIKLDREERPDLDRVYMSYIQASTGSGGWPMSVWLTPERKPFFGGTYFPPNDRYGRPGFNSLLKKIAESWSRDESNIRSVADRATAQLLKFATQIASSDSINLTPEVFEKAAKQFISQFDGEWGGYGGAPKFPRPSVLNFMLNYAHTTGDMNALNSALFTLKKMAEGGMHDLISVQGKGGGGFARYSTDKFWHVPHFEKMLYDNAQLASTYLDAFLLTKEEQFKSVAEDIFNYVLCDMRDSVTGGFYSAEDADSLPSHDSSHKTEGAFYVWEQDEIDQILGEKNSEIFSYVFGVKPSGNAPSDPHNEFVLKNILIRRVSDEEAAKRFSLTIDEIKSILLHSIERLYSERLKRPKPHLDDKILTSWNGLMISALAKGFAVLGKEEYKNAATKAADFILSKMVDENQKNLKRRYREGESAINGMADDYSNFIQALLDLYEVTFDARYFLSAISLSESMINLFYDNELGGFFNSSSENTDVLFHLKEDHDGAEPSPNSVAILNFLRLSSMTDREDFKDVAEKTILYFTPLIQKSPSYIPQMLIALQFHLSKSVQLIFTGDRKDETFKELHKQVFKRFLPNKILLRADSESVKGYPFLKTLIDDQLKGEPRAYLCVDYACQLPTSNPQELNQKLQEISI